MIGRLFRRKRSAPEQPSPVSPARQDKPDLAGRRAFLDAHILIHTHIPKTGGSTISAALSNIVGGVNSMDFRLGRRVPMKEMTPEDLRRISFVSGHFPYGLHTRFDRKPLYIAAVRHPVERAVSGYRFLQDSTDHPNHHLVDGRTFEEAWQAEREANGKAADNLQARQLTATGKRKEVSEDVLWDNVENNYFLVIPQPELTLALNRLRNAFGLPFQRPLRQNVSKAPEVDITTEMRTRIMAANRTDMELFARVSEDFTDNLNRACDYVASHCLLPLKDGNT